MSEYLKGHLHRLQIEAAEKFDAWVVSSPAAHTVEGFADVLDEVVQTAFEAGMAAAHITSGSV